MDWKEFLNKDRGSRGLDRGIKIVVTLIIVLPLLLIVVMALTCAPPLCN